jgi:hypothetical protein
VVKTLLSIPTISALLMTANYIICAVLLTFRNGPAQKACTQYLFTWAGYFLSLSLFGNAFKEYLLVRSRDNEHLSMKTMVQTWLRTYTKSILGGVGLFFCCIALAVGLSLRSKASVSTYVCARYRLVCLAQQSTSLQYCFQDIGELKDAVDLYFQYDCPNDKTCWVGRRFGWPIGSWCISEITDLSYVFFNVTSDDGQFLVSRSFLEPPFGMCSL